MANNIFYNRMPNDTCYNTITNNVSYSKIKAIHMINLVSCKFGLVCFIVYQPQELFTADKIISQLGGMLPDIG